MKYAPFNTEFRKLESIIMSLIITNKSKAPAAIDNVEFTTESTLALGDDFTHILTSDVNGTCLAHLNLIIN